MRSVITVFLCILCLPATLLAHADPYHEHCFGSHVSTPCDPTVWHSGIEVFFAQAATSDQQFAFHQLGDPTVNSSVVFSEVDPEFQIGVLVWGSYRLGWGDDLLVSYEHLSGDTKEVAINNVQPLFVYGSLAGPTGDRQIADFDFTFDNITLELAQTVQFGEDYSVRVHFGAQASRIEFLKIIMTESLQNLIATHTYDAEFNGGGGRVGLDTTWHMNDRFSLLTQSAGALLLGDSDLTARVRTPAMGLLQSSRLVSSSIIIPAVMLKAAIRYHTEVYQMALTMDLGWHLEAYFHALRFYQSQVMAATLIAGTETTNPQSIANYETFSFHGPYIAFLLRI